MDIEKQVCSLELAKRLKELKVKQKSLFYWIREDDPYIWYNNNNHPMYCEKFYYSAFTPSELSELLPNRVSITDREPFDSYTLVIRKFYYVPDIQKEPVNCY